MKSWDNILNRALLKYQEHVGSVPAPQKWLFLVGCYNSGTTLLHKILSMHNDIGSMKVEGQNCTSQFRTPKAMNLQRLWVMNEDYFHITEDSPDSKVATKVKRQWGHHFNDAKRPVLLDKSITNAARIRWLNRYFENAYFIAIIRDGYAVSEGIHRKAGHSYALCARQWARSNRIMLDDLERIPRKLIIYYEEFTRDPDNILKAITEFVGLDDSIPALKPGDITWNIHGTKNRIRNMNDVSHENLSDRDREQIESEAKDMLMTHGYIIES